MQGYFCAFVTVRSSGIPTAYVWNAAILANVGASGGDIFGKMMLKVRDMLWISL